MADSSYMIAPGETSDSLSMRKKLALALAQKNLEPLKVDHWAQGLAHLGDQAYSGYEIGKINRDEKEENAKANALMVALWGGQAPGAVPAAAPAPAVPQQRPAGVSTPMGDALKNYKPADPNAPSVPVAADPGAPVNIPRPEVMPTAKVWGDKEAEVAGLYEPTSTKPGFQDRFAAVTPTAPVATDAGAITPKPVPTQKMAEVLAKPPAAPAVTAPAPGVNREAVIQMLNNPKTRPFAQKIISDQVMQQFKPQDYDIHHRADGTVIAVNKKNPQDMRTIAPPGASDALIKFEADKTAATKKAGEIGEAQGKGIVGLPTYLTKAEDALSVIDKVRRHPGIDRSTGAMGAVWSAPGTAAKDFDVLNQQLKGKAFIEAFEGLKGGGAISEKEGEAATAAIARLNQSQSKEAYLEALGDLEKIIRSGIANARSKTGAAAPAATAPVTATGGWQDLGGGVRIREKR